jgi:hypothetical protein
MDMGDTSKWDSSYVAMCYHEAGHAVGLFAQRLRFQKVTVFSRVVDGVRIADRSELTDDPEQKMTAEQYAIMVCAGPIAEAAVVGAMTVDEHWEAVLAAAAQEAKGDVGTAKHYLQRWREQGVQLLQLHWDEVVRLANALMVCHERDYDQALAAFETPGIAARIIRRSAEKEGTP